MLPAGDRRHAARAGGEPQSLSAADVRAGDGRPASRPLLRRADRGDRGVGARALRLELQERQRARRRVSVVSRPANPAGCAAVRSRKGFVGGATP